MAQFVGPTCPVALRPPLHRSWLGCGSCPAPGGCHPGCKGPSVSPAPDAYRTGDSRWAVSKANSGAPQAPPHSAPAHTCRYKLKAIGWFRSVMKKSPRFSSFFRCSTVNTAGRQGGVGIQPSLLLSPGSPASSSPKPAHPDQYPHSRWPCLVPVCSSSSSGEGGLAPQSVAHIPAAVGRGGRHREKELAWGPLTLT